MKKHKRHETRVARIVEIGVPATNVTVRPAYRHGRKLPEVILNIVLAEETNPTDGATPVQWLLVTTLPIDHVEQVRQALLTTRFAGKLKFTFAL